MDKIKYIKNITIVREEAEPDLMLIKATGIADLKSILTPNLISAKPDAEPAKDGIYELDFVLGKTGNDSINVEMEVDIVFRMNKIPSWIKGIKINAAENSDIELL